MQRALARLGVLAIFAAILASGYAGWRWVRASDEESCYACQRPVHRHSKTVAYYRGKRAVFCCPTCAFWQHRQGGRPVTVSELTDYETGDRLRPSGAFLVEASDVNPCIQPHNHLLEAGKPAAAMHFDRCAPGLLAFVGRHEAERFAALHGGRVRSFPEIASRYGP